MTESLFPSIVDPVDETAGLSYGQRLTLRKRALIDAGYHPMSMFVPGLRLASNGHTCGDCALRVVHSRSGTWHKCALHPAKSEAADIRVRWPACEKWEPAELRAARPDDKEQR